MKAHLSHIISLLKHVDADVRKNVAELIASLADDFTIRPTMPFADLYPTLLSFLADDLPELATAACQILYRFCGTASFRQYITQQDNVITPLFAILQNRQKTQVYPITLQLLIQLTRDGTFLSIAFVPFAHCSWQLRAERHWRQSTTSRRFKS